MRSVERWFKSYHQCGPFTLGTWAPTASHLLASVYIVLLGMAPKTFSDKPINKLVLFNINSTLTLTCSHFWRCSQRVFTSLASPRPVFASLDLSQLPYSCPSLAMSSGWSSPESLLSLESLCCHKSSFSFRVPCPWSSLSLEFLVLGVLQRSFTRLPPVFLELSLYSPMTSSFHHSVAALCLCS